MLVSREGFASHVFAAGFLGGGLFYRILIESFKFEAGSFVQLFTNDTVL